MAYKARNEDLSIHRQHNCPHWKCQEICTEVPKTNDWVQQSHMIQDTQTDTHTHRDTQIHKHKHTHAHINFFILAMKKYITLIFYYPYYLVFWYVGVLDGSEETACFRVVNS
jgi:hypothetical protein